MGVRAAVAANPNVDNTDGGEVVETVVKKTTRKKSTTTST